MTEKKTWTAAELEDLRQAQTHQIREFEARQARVPDVARRPISNSGKFGFPIGMDDAGNFFLAASDSVQSAADAPQRGRGSDVPCRRD